MIRSRSAIVSLLVVTLFLNTGAGGAASSVEARGVGAGPDLRGAQGTQLPEVQVMLSAAHSTVSWDSRLANQIEFHLPLLYLHRERESTAQADRTLMIHLSGLAGGAEVDVEVVSRHVDVSTGDRHRAVKRFLLPDRPCTSDNPCAIAWTFDATTMLSDFYYLRVKDQAGNLLWDNPHPDRPDFVILDTWDVGVDEYTVRVYYATLFPFARGQNDLEDRLPPDAVPDFIEHQFAPIIVDTWSTQFHAWGFAPIHPDWDPDKIVEIFVTDSSFALFGGTGTYTSSVFSDGSPYPERRLWWFSSNDSFQAYDSLENGYKAVYAHEFFHMVQWNVLLFAGCSTQKWQNVFIEAQGKFAPSVQYPDLEMLRGHMVDARSEFGDAASRFLTYRLNTPYRVLEAETTHRYDATLYWRFLYEQFGDMGVIRAALEEMACQYHPDIEVALGGVMDAALARFDGPVQTFEESLIAFARANFALHLENGRCGAADPTGCEGNYYDPHSVYTAPPLEAELRYDGTALTYDGSIPASFGMDFVQVHLDRDLYGQPVTVTFQSEGARFDVQIWKLDGGKADPGAAMLGSKLGDGRAKPRALTPDPETMSGGHGNLYVHSIPHLDPREYDRLTLIITRLDADERIDPMGNYRITLDSASDAGNDDALK